MTVIDDAVILTGITGVGHSQPLDVALRMVEQSASQTRLVTFGEPMEFCLRTMERIDGPH